MEFNSGPSFQLSRPLLECLILLQYFDWLQGFYAHIRQKNGTSEALALFKALMGGYLQYA